MGVKFSGLKSIRLGQFDSERGFIWVRICFTSSKCSTKFNSCRTKLKIYNLIKSLREELFQEKYGETFSRIMNIPGLVLFAICMLYLSVQISVPWVYLEARRGQLYLGQAVRLPAFHLYLASHHSTCAIFHRFPSLFRNHHSTCYLSTHFHHISMIPDWKMTKWWWYTSLFTSLPLNKIQLVLRITLLTRYNFKKITNSSFSINPKKSLSFPLYL